MCNVCTVCPGSSDPPEKILNIFASENEVYTPFFNFYDILGWILFVYRAKYFMSNEVNCIK